MRKSRIAQILDGDQPSPQALARYKMSSSLEERLYATTDANHNVTSIDDVFGAVQERFIYDPYRQSTVLSAAWASTSDTLAWSIRSQGEREDATTNTIDGRNRLYGIGMGRWMQADSEGYIDGANRYQFVESNPVDGLDPSGHFGSSVHRSITEKAAANWQSFNPNGLHFVSPDYLWQITNDNVGTDIGVHFFDEEFHAQVPGLGRFVDNMSALLEQIKGNNYKNVLKAMGQSLHGLQDFYSHTDWIEGNSPAMLGLYQYYIDHGYKDEGLKEKAKSGHDGKLLLIERLDDKTIKPQLEATLAYEEGYIPFGTGSQHNRYGADSQRTGRDLHSVGLFNKHQIGISGAFERASGSAEANSELLFEWAADNMTCSVYLKLFGKPK